MKRFRVLAWWVFVTSLLAAAEPGHAKAPDINPCTLMTKAEAATIMGELKAEPKTEIGLLNEKECHYENLQGQHVVLRIYGADRWGLKKGEVSEMKPVAIPGLGDEAFAVQRGTEFEIYVRKGEVILEVNASTSKEIAQKMAGMAVSRLK
jgi:hypothetical protein